MTRRQPIEYGFGSLSYLVLTILFLIGFGALCGCSYAPTPEGDIQREADAKMVEEVSGSASAITTALPPPWNLIAAAGLGVVGTVVAGRIRKGKKGETTP